MMPTRQGSLHLFRAFGINVFVHWSWFFLALWAMDHRRDAYFSPIWNVYEYLGLFAIVLMHEFGHALACRSVGGKADQIVLWPFGGVAYVAPPQRAGATLWSIVAGPLVNVVLIPVFFFVNFAMMRSGAAISMPDTARMLEMLGQVNKWMLIFNLLPVYPLDGGQILRSLLWFPFGRVRSLQVATIIGFIGVALFGAFALWTWDLWLGLVTAFLFSNCRQGWLHARALAEVEKVNRRRNFSCPECHAHPPEGPFWICGKCNARFDIFAEHGTCPHCSASFPAARCSDCGAWNSVEEWIRPSEEPLRPERPVI